MTHAIRFHKTGGPEVLVWEEVKLGKPGPGEARIRHTAVGLNFVDIYNRSGLYPAQLPSGLGGEAAGVVEEVGRRRHRSEAGRPRRLWRRADRRLCRSAADPGRSSAETARRHRRQDRRRHDAEGPDDAIPDPPDLSRQSRRHHPAACRGRRRRPDPRPMGEASRRHRDRHRRQRREGKTRQGPWLRPHHRLYARGFRQARRRDHRRQEGAGGLRLRRQGHLPEIARLPGAARRRRTVRPVLRQRRAAQSRHPRAKGLAVTSPARRSTPMPPSARTSSRWRTNCSTS